MSKETFLMQLEQLLYDIPREEREEAMGYYRSYFEDAGVENEAAVLEELESPQSVAAGIKEGLNGAGDKSDFLKNPPQLREAQPEPQQQADSYEYGGRNGKEAGSYEYGSQDSKEASSYEYGTQDGKGAGSYEYGSRKGQDGKGASGYGYGGKGGQGAGGYGQGGKYGQYGQKERKEQFQMKWTMSNKMKWILAILILIFALPNIKWLLSCIFGLAGAVIGAVVLLAVVAVGGVIGGMICIIVGIVKICMMSLAGGLLILGIGMLLMAAGGISIILLMLLCIKVLPWAVNKVSDLVHSLWNWGRSKV